MGNSCCVFQFAIWSIPCQPNKLCCWKRNRWRYEDAKKYDLDFKPYGNDLRLKQRFITDYQRLVHNDYHTSRNRVHSCCDFLLLVYRCLWCAFFLILFLPLYLVILLVPMLGWMLLQGYQIIVGFLVLYCCCCCGHRCTRYRKNVIDSKDNWTFLTFRASQVEELRFEFYKYPSYIQMFATQLWLRSSQYLAGLFNAKLISDDWIVYWVHMWSTTNSRFLYEYDRDTHQPSRVKGIVDDYSSWTNDAVNSLLWEWNTFEVLKVEIDYDDRCRITIFCRNGDVYREPRFEECKPWDPYRNLDRLSDAQWQELRVWNIAKAHLQCFLSIYPALVHTWTHFHLNDLTLRYIEQTWNDNINPYQEIARVLGLRRAAPEDPTSAAHTYPVKTVLNRLIRSHTYFTSALNAYGHGADYMRPQTKKWNWCEFIAAPWKALPAQEDIVRTAFVATITSHYFTDKIEVPDDDDDEDDDEDDEDDDDDSRTVKTANTDAEDTKYDDDDDDDEENSSSSTTHDEDETEDGDIDQLIEMEVRRQHSVQSLQRGYSRGPVSAREESEQREESFSGSGKYRQSRPFDLQLGPQLGRMPSLKQKQSSLSAKHKKLLQSKRQSQIVEVPRETYGYDDKGYKKYAPVVGSPPVPVASLSVSPHTNSPDACATDAAAEEKKDGRAKVIVNGDWKDGEHYKFTASAKQIIENHRKHQIESFLPAEDRDKQLQSSLLLRVGSTNLNAQEMHIVKQKHVATDTMVFNSDVDDRRFPDVALNVPHIPNHVEMEKILQKAKEQDSIQRAAQEAFQRSFTDKTADPGCFPPLFVRERLPMFCAEFHGGSKYIEMHRGYCVYKDFLADYYDVVHREFTVKLYHNKLITDRDLEIWVIFLEKNGFPGLIKCKRNGAYLHILSTFLWLNVAHSSDHTIAFIMLSTFGPGASYVPLKSEDWYLQHRDYNFRDVLQGKTCMSRWRLQYYALRNRIFWHAFGGPSRDGCFVAHDMCDSNLYRRFIDVESITDAQRVQLNAIHDHYISKMEQCDEKYRWIMPVEDITAGVSY